MRRGARLVPPPPAAGGRGWVASLRRGGGGGLGGWGGGGSVTPPLSLFLCRWHGTAESDHTGLVTTGLVTVRSPARGTDPDAVRSERAASDGRGAVEQTPIRCDCGRVHPDPSVLTHLGGLS